MYYFITVTLSIIAFVIRLGAVMAVAYAIKYVLETRTNLSNQAIIPITVVLGITFFVILYFFGRYGLSFRTF